MKNIHVEDDCDRNDPWNTTEPLRSENIWPRDDAGTVLSNQIGVTSFRAMLKDKRLCPETIRIRDYRIDNANFKLCPKTTRIRDYRIGTGTPTVPDSEPAAALARDIFDSVDVAIFSLDMQTLQLELSENSILKSPSLAPGESLCGPQISEVIIGLSPEHQGQGAGFSLLRSVRLLVIPYWLERVLDRALNLESLEISAAKSWDVMLAAGTHYPSLKKLSIQSLKLHSRMVSTVLANSKHSLTSISFIMVTLVQDSTWTELLSSIGGSFPNLTYFRIQFVRQGDAPSSTVTFLGFGEDRVMEQYRPGLELDERGPSNDRRLTRIIYHGPDAGLVLRTLAVYAVLRGLR